jgi:hypothetical protein
MTAGRARTRRGLGLFACAAAACLALLVLAGGAEAAIKGAATITFPPAMTVGDTGKPAVLTLANTNDEPDEARTNTVCNAGDGSPCVAGERGITLIPSCKQLLAGLCSPAGHDPGVFALSATGAGRIGSRCQGVNFDIAPSDPVTGAVRFTVSGGGHLTLMPTPPLSFCLIDFTIDVLKAPAGDSNPALAGVQTAQVTQHTQHSNGTGVPVAAAINTTTITRAAPTINSTASPSVNLGGGQITDSAVVLGRVAGVDGATIDFRLYDPDDVTCAGAPVFESLGVPYPAGGGSVTSEPFKTTKTGTYRWIDAYSGDANNLPVSGACGLAGESVLVNPAVPGTFPNGPGGPGGLGGTAGYCFGRPATIVATPGQKTITGTPGADVIIGGAAGETINARGGNDLICAGRGNDKVSGGAGNDKIRGEAGNDKLTGDSGADLLLGSGGADDLRGGTGNDRAAGGDGTDRIDGGAGDDVLDDQKLGGAGKDRILGGAGKDRIRTAGGAADVVDCGAGRDTLLRDADDKQQRCELVTRS